MRGRDGLELPDQHAPVLLCIAHDRACGCATSRPGRGVTERTAYGIVTDRTEAGDVVKHQDGRRNRSPRPTAGNSAVGEILALLAGADDEATG